MTDDSKDEIEDAKVSEKKPEKKSAKKTEKKPEKVKAVVVVVAEGKAITTKRGMRKAGDAIKASDLSGGDNALDKLLKSGVCCVVD